MTAHSVTYSEKPTFVIHAVDGAKTSYTMQITSAHCVHAQNLFNSSSKLI